MWLSLSSLTLTFLLLSLTGECFAKDFECRWADTPPKIDGVLDEVVWIRSSTPSPCTAR